MRIASPSLFLCFCLFTPAKVEIVDLPFDPDSWKPAERVRFHVQENGRDVVYSGVPLAIVLRDRAKNQDGMAFTRSLADAVIVVRGADDYQASVSAAAAWIDEKGERYILTTERDGKPLDAKHGPVMLAIPAEKKRVRWVRSVVSLGLLQPPKTDGDKKANK